MKEVIFLKPALVEKVWGGNKLDTVFGLELPSDNIGEAWLASAHPNGVSKVISPAKYEGLGLDELYEKEPELFGEDHPEPFPLLTKIIDAKDDLSVQVHPNDEYSKIHEGELGKYESWYIIDAEEGASIVYGHTAASREEFADRVEKGEWNELLTKVEVKPGDFFDVPPGTIHAIGAGVLLLEVQQNSDVTYRVYDYDRPDADGNLRELHIEKSLDTTNYPHVGSKTEPETVEYAGGSVTRFVTNEYYSVGKWAVDGELTLETAADYTVATVVKGEGELEVDGDNYSLKPADTFILPNAVSEVTLKGELTLVFAEPELGGK